MKRTPVLVALVFAVSVPARAQAPGIYAEQNADIDGIHITRVRDTSTGAVCYLVTSKTVAGGGTPYIIPTLACLPAVPSFQPFSSPYKEKLREP